MGSIRTEYNIYCDESCHLINDNVNVMALGAVWCQSSVRNEIFQRIREIKVEHGLSPTFEIKWNKVSPAKVDFYIDLVNYFFDNHDLHFRALVVPDKFVLDHKAFNQTHDEFYYKMYFDLLKTILNPHCGYNIYIDIKDTRSKDKLLKLQDVLRSSHYDFHEQIIKRIQHTRSNEVEILQLTDLLLGAITYVHRGLTTNKAKIKIIDKIKSRTGYNLIQSTLYKEDKMNIFIWQHSKK